MRKKLINKVAAKRSIGKCFFCDCDDYAVLDCHRIVPGEDGGEYFWWNTLIICSNCHRKVHAGQIIVDRKYQTSNGKCSVHYWTVEDDIKEEHWKNAT